MTIITDRKHWGGCVSTLWVVPSRSHHENIVWAGASCLAAEQVLNFIIAGSDAGQWNIRFYQFRDSMGDSSLSDYYM
jgi:hypothetical protein